MEKSYKFRIYPTNEQSKLIQRTFGCCRFVYNHFLAQRIETYKETGKSPTRFVQDKDLTKLKQEIDWLREPDKCSLQNALKDLDTAYQNFFRGCKTGQRIGFPKYKSKRNNRKKYKTQSNVKIFDKAIRLPKLGLVECRVSKQIEGRILSATVSQNPSGKYFVSICCTDVEFKPLPKTGAVVGIDVGVKELAITSDGLHIQNHKYLAKSEKKIKKLQRQLSRKSKGSNNREKTRIKLARAQEHVVNQRVNTLHNLSTKIVREYDVIALETLAPKNMVKNHRLAKSISDASWGEFVRQLEYKAGWYGKTVIKIDRFYPSSQMCSVCGAINKATKDLTVREWKCPICGACHDRDVNAAINILNEGMRLLA